ncbi:MAG: hypothetical protein JWQ35_1900 [Bacteriovoracaceae bacterium]|nr:hypothetical protein [Bacteriovoracaceae bacterium]
MIACRIKYFWIFFCALCFESCGTSIVREFVQTPPTFSVEAPVAMNALVINLVDKISDTGDHLPQLSISLVNSRDSTGQLWSDLLGSNFNIQFGSQNVAVSLANTSGANLEGISFTAQPTLSNSVVASLLGKSITLLKTNGTAVSSQALSPSALSDFSASLPPLSQRLVSPCRLDPSDPDPNLSWSNQGNTPLALQFGSNPIFSLSVPDTGSWLPVKNLFSTFFSTQDLAAADQNIGTTSLLSMPLKLQRISNQSLRISAPGSLDRSLQLSITIEEDLNTNIQYVGGCGI